MIPMKWIKCSERMPENITEVIAYGKCLCGTCGDAIDVVCVKYRPVECEPKVTI